MSSRRPTLFHADAPDPPAPAAVRAEIEVLPTGIPGGAVVPASVARDARRLVGMEQVEYPDIEIMTPICIVAAVGDEGDLVAVLRPDGIEVVELGQVGQVHRPAAAIGHFVDVALSGFLIYKREDDAVGPGADVGLRSAALRQVGAKSGAELSHVNPRVRAAVDQGLI